MSTIPTGSTKDPRQLLASIARDAHAQKKLKLPSQQAATDTIAPAPVEEAPQTEGEGGFCSSLTTCIANAFASVCNCITSFFHWITCYCFAAAKTNEEQAPVNEPAAPTAPDAPPRSPSPIHVADDRLAVPASTEPPAEPTA